MKKIVTILLSCFLLATASKAQYVNIPDTSFGIYLIAQYPSCLYKDSANKYWMDTTCGSVMNEDSLDYYGGSGGPHFNNKLVDLEGVQYFKNLQYLFVDANAINNIPALPNKLKEAILRFNQLAILPKLPDSLIKLDLYQNQLTALPALPNGLQILDVLGNPITTLPKLPDSLNNLRTFATLITCLPYLPSKLSILNTDVLCLPNIPVGLTTTIPICNATNNPNNCPIFGAAPNYVNVPDSNFGKFLIAKYPSCLYKDSANKYWVDTTCSGVVNALTMNCNFKGIASLDGLQYFKSLLNFSCSNNSLTSLPTLSASLTYLECKNNQIISLPALPNGLQILKCDFNQITALPTLPSTLVTLECNINLLPILPTLPNSLTKINCNYNQLSSLPNLPSNIYQLECSNNQLTSLPALPNSLLNLYCDNNSLASLPTLPAGLATLYCSANQLVILPALPNTINTLLCSINQLTSLPTLPSSLGNFDCSSNLLTSIPTLPQNIFTFFCYANNIQCLPTLPSTINLLRFDSAKIACISNIPKPSTLIYNAYWANTFTPLVCNATNNPNNCYAPYVNIPDSNFGKFLIAQYPSCLYKDSANKYWMDTTCSGVVNEDSLDCQSKGIANLDGLQYFTFLKKLDCRYNQLSSLSTLPNVLENIDCRYNQLSSLPSLPNSLKNLVCADNQLIDLPSLSNSLLFLDCDGNLLTSLPTLPNSLKNLYCGSNQLSNLPTLPNSLNELYCDVNQITSLPSLPSSLTALGCSKNQLSSLPSLPNSLLGLYCAFNQISNLPSLSNSITYLDCGNNQLSVLPILPDSLKELNCADNQISCLPKLPYTLTFLYFFNTQILCLPNTFLGYNASTLLPICNPTNNANECLAFPTVYGNVFTDVNSNGVKDANEFYRPFVKVSLNTGETAYTNLNGAFAISTDSVGSYTLKTTPPALFTAVPDSTNFSFTQYNTTLTLADIALQPTSIKDSFVIATTAYNNSPRPGFNYTYNVGYADVGTVNATTNNIVHFNFDSSRLIFDSASVPVQSIINGNEILVNAGALFAGQWGRFNLHFTLKTTAILGDSLKAAAQITYSTTKAFTYYAANIVGSYDPNDKQATPEMTPTQVVNGEFIEYTVRFQNTGTDTAINVVIADTLSPLLQANILKILGQSHNVNISITNGIIYFEFLNIYLPDSNVNQLLSNGYIKFQLKPITGATLGTIIPNKASIYFDYNVPIVTNIASTIIKTPTLPVRIFSYSLRQARGDKNKIENSWMVGVETNVSHYVIQRSINGKDFSIVGKVGANNSVRYTFTDELTTNLSSTIFYYRLQIIDKDGSYTYSEVKIIELNEKQETRNVVLFPNPARDIVNIETANAKGLLIIDNLGRIVKQSIVHSPLTIVAVKQLSKGLHLVKLMMNNGEIRTAKLVIE